MKTKARRQFQMGIAGFGTVANLILACIAFYLRGEAAEGAFFMGLACFCQLSYIAIKLEED